MDYTTVLKKFTKMNQNNQLMLPKPCSPIKFSMLKKASKPTEELSDRIKKFLAKQEEERRLRMEEERRKKENLMALRDDKAKRRINKHLKLCKAANKSVLDNALDKENNTTTNAEFTQFDKDDYDNVSPETSLHYNNFIKMYFNVSPEKPLHVDNSKQPVNDIATTKDRFKQFLKRLELKKRQPGDKKKQKNHNYDDKHGSAVDTEVVTNDNNKNNEREREIKNQKNPKLKKKPMIPPMDSMSILKLAEQKQHEPIKANLKFKTKMEPKRSMTSKPMKECAKKKTAKKKSNNNKLKFFTKISNMKSINKTQKIETSSNGLATIREKFSSDNPNPKKPTENVNESCNTVPEIKQKISSELDKIAYEWKKLEKEKKILEEERRLIEEEKKELKLIKSTNIDAKSNSNSASSVHDSWKPLASSNVKKAKSKSKIKKRPISTDYEDSDSDMKDFIDDTNAEYVDYSKYIVEIFGYDKSKYNELDEYDNASFAEELKMEYFTKMKYQDDEAMRKENEENERKQKMRQPIKKKRKMKKNIFIL